MPRDHRWKQIFFRSEVIAGEDRHFQDSQGQERPEVGRSTVVHYWDGRVWAAFASVKPATYFIGNTDPLQKSLPRPLREVDRRSTFLAGGPNTDSSLRGRGAALSDTFNFPVPTVLARGANSQ